MVKLQLDVLRSLLLRTVASFRFGMVKLQPDRWQFQVRCVVSFRFGMVKLQHLLARRIVEGGDTFPLWHGKVATQKIRR